MKKYKWYLVILLVLVSSFCTNANASSINYKLHVSKDRHLSETITYIIENNNTNDYLNSILNNSIYFDTANTVVYKKTIHKTSSSNIVTLKTDYDSQNIENSKLLNECFKSFSYEEDDYGIRYYAVNPFLCSNHADKITISVTTDIRTIIDDATEVNGNTYVWEKIDNDFSMDLSLGRYSPDYEVLEPVEDDYADADNADDIDEWPETTIKPFPYKTVIIIASCVLLIAVGGVIVFAKTNRKHSKQNTTEDEFKL